MTIRSSLLLLHCRVVSAQESFRPARTSANNWHVWAVHRAVPLCVAMRCWMTLRYSSKFFRGAKPIDEMTLEDIIRKRPNLYFLEGAPSSSNKWLIVDVSARTSFYTVGSLTCYAKASFFALEANHEAIDLLKRNLVANNLFGRSGIVEAAFVSQDSFALLEYSACGPWKDRNEVTKNQGIPPVESEH